MAVGGAEERDPGKWAVVMAWVTCVLALSAQGAAPHCHRLLPLWAFQKHWSSHLNRLGFPVSPAGRCRPQITLSPCLYLLSHIWESCLGAGWWLQCLLCLGPCRYKAQVAGGAGGPPPEFRNRPITRTPEHARPLGFWGAWSTWHRLKWGGKTHGSWWFSKLWWLS